MLRILQFSALCTALMGMFSSHAFALDGYDHINHTRITIVAGDSISIGEDIGIYNWETKQFRPVEVENIVKRGDDLEIEVHDRLHNTQTFFEIRADDPGVDSLPEFDPGLPFPEVLSPQVHMEHDLLAARGNMTDRGNLLERGNILERGSQLEQGNLIERGEPQNNEHLLYQGFQPIEQ
jgi:hypothetical protein